MIGQRNYEHALLENFLLEICSGLFLLLFSINHKSKIWSRFSYRRNLEKSEKEFCYLFEQKAVHYLKVLSRLNTFAFALTWLSYSFIFSFPFCYISLSLATVFLSLLLYFLSLCWICYVCRFLTHTHSHYKSVLSISHSFLYSSTCFYLCFYSCACLSVCLSVCLFLFLSSECLYLCLCACLSVLLSL